MSEHEFRRFEEVESKIKSVDWTLENDYLAISAKEAQLGNMLTGWDEDAVDNVKNIFREGVLNAIIHGNLELDPDALKKKLAEEQGEDKAYDLFGQEWEKLIKETARQPEMKNKKVHVAVKFLTPEHIILEIEDHGKNADKFIQKHKNEDYDRVAQERLIEMSGRGLITIYYSAKEIGPQSTIGFEKTSKGLKLIADLILDKKNES